jgi:hypothetical protein
MLVYQIVALVFGIIAMGDDVSLPLSGQALMIAQGMHIVLRIAGIGLCIYAVTKMGEKTRTIQQTPSLT